MAPPTAPAKIIDGGAAADDANLPTADVVAEEEPIAVAESVETVEPLAAATLGRGRRAGRRGPRVRRIKY